VRFRTRVRVGVLLCLGVAVTAPILAAEARPPATQPQAVEEHFSRAEVTGIVKDARRIVSENGVEEILEIPIGGSRQWISVRGRDRSNPILLMIHGGPASPEMPTSWYFQSGWEDYFTVVQWDQRGSGKSYNANNPQSIQPTLSLERITEDAHEVAQYLLARYAQPKLFVLGHSWGSLVGLQLAHRHPELLYAYVGMGQIINGRESERVGYQMTLQAARTQGNAKAVAELESIAPYPNPDGSVPLDKINTERKWSVAFGGLTWGRGSLDYYEALTQLAPEYTEADIAAIDKGSRLSLGPLLPAMVSFDYSNVTQWRCPIIVFAGRHDTTTPSSVTAAWLEHVVAPAKKLIWFEDSAHMMMVEEPGRVLVHLVEDVRPLAQ
jgi:proline iminopeptidase